MTKKPLPRYEIKEFIEKKKDGAVKSVTYGIVKPNGDVVNEYKTDDRQDRVKYLNRLVAMGYCTGDCK